MTLLDSFLELYDRSTVEEHQDRVELDFTAKDIKLLNCPLSPWLDANVIRLTSSDDIVISWSEISALNDDSRCHLNLLKAHFIRQVICCDTDTNTDTAQYVFFSVREFSNWLSQLPSPLDGNHPFHQRKRNLVWVRGLDQCHRGHALAIIPLGHEGDIDFSSSSHALPSDTAIRSQVHFLSNNPVRVDPVLFSLPDGSFDNIELKPLFVCYEKVLGACLVKEYVSEDSVVVSGIKRLNLSLYKDNNHNAQLSDIKALEKAVCWVYDERSQTRSLLLMDRISLDITENGSFVPELYRHLGQALRQAKDRYEFVIKDRKEDHAKELSQLQKDIKVATDSYSAATNDLVCGLFRDVLSSIFFVTLMLFPRLIGSKDILQGGLGIWLFYSLAVYLLVSVFIRIYIGLNSLKLSLRDIYYWQDTTRNHMSKSEFRKHVCSRTKPYQEHYCYNAKWIVFIYILLAVLLFVAPEALKDNIGVETLDAAYPSVSNIDRMVPIKIPNANIGEGASQSVSPIDAGKESEGNKLKKSDGSSAIKEGDAGPP